MATNAAMPKVIELEKSNKRRRLDRLSRHAIRQTQGRQKAHRPDCELEVT
jgi:hypothetical protein